MPDHIIVKRQQRVASRKLRMFLHCLPSLLGRVRDVASKGKGEQRIKGGRRPAPLTQRLERQSAEAMIGPYEECSAPNLPSIKPRAS